MGLLAGGPGVPSEKTLAVFSAATREFPPHASLCSALGHDRTLAARHVTNVVRIRFLAHSLT
ncbi:hypothetical protein E2C01_005213 [Portunus trituberculatus]|uniref:Uncharacterized protein n=1 Tax=Portunus trituberculatus TaxID=210409 RepID=A0A5B7CUX7_PORTR|nr:hypothetical protein [Portunus trituberculatus]